MNNANALCSHLGFLKKCSSTILPGKGFLEVHLFHLKYKVCKLPGKWIQGLSLEYFSKLTFVLPEVFHEKMCFVPRKRKSMILPKK